MLAFCAAVLFACIPEPVDIDPAPFHQYQWFPCLSDGSYFLKDENCNIVGWIMLDEDGWYWTSAQGSDGEPEAIHWLPPPPTPWYSRKHVPFIVIQPQ
jgi:hypothetical protein